MKTLEKSTLQSLPMAANVTANYPWKILLGELWEGSPVSNET